MSASPCRVTPNRYCAIGCCKELLKELAVLTAVNEAFSHKPNGLAGVCYAVFLILRLICFVILHLLLGPRFAFNFFLKKQLLTSWSWQQYVPGKGGIDNVQQSLAEGSQFSANLFLIAGLIVTMGSPASVQQDTRRWQLLTSAAVLLIIMSLLQALSGLTHKSLHRHSHRYLSRAMAGGSLDGSNQYEPKMAIQKLQAHATLQACLKMMTALQSLTFWWMFRLALVMVIMFITCVLESRHNSFKPGLSVCLVVISALAVALVEVWSIAYTYSIDELSVIVAAGMTKDCNSNVEPGIGRHALQEGLG